MREAARTAMHSAMLERMIVRGPDGLRILKACHCLRVNDTFPHSESQVIELGLE